MGDVLVQAQDIADTLTIIRDSLEEITSAIQTAADSTSTEIIRSGTKLFDKITGKFLVRLCIDIISLLVVIRLIYYQKYGTKAFFLTFGIFNIVIFLISYLLNKVDLSLGAAFGLFAVFGIMRYRSEDISIRDLTYLFIVITLGLLSAIARGSWEEIAFYNFIVIAATYLLESKIWGKRENVKIIIYDSTANLRPEKRNELIEDIKKRTGHNIKKIEIQTIDYLRDSAILRVYYEE